MDLWNKTNSIMTVSANTDTSPEAANLQTQAAISEAILWYFVTYVSTIIIFILSPLGVTINVVNIIVYRRQGIRESVNITFISLSLWNLVSCLLFCLAEIFLAIDKFSPLRDVNMLSLHYVCLGYTKGFAHVTITFITVYLTVERSICIMFPFKVKQVFTAWITTVVNLVAVVFGLVCFCPVWATHGMKWMTDPITNRSRLDLWVSDNRRDVELFVNAVTGMTIPVLAQILISASTGFMLHGINKSKKFRQRLNRKEEMSAIHIGTNQINGSMTISGKDIKLTKVVIWLAMIFFVCNSPVFVVCFLRVLMPEEHAIKDTYRLHTFLYSLVFVCSVINSTVNIFVYYNVSSRYRKEFMVLFSRRGFVKSSI